MLCSVHAQTHVMLCTLSNICAICVCLSFCEPTRLLVRLSVHQFSWLQCPHTASRSSLVSMLPALHTTYPLSLCQLMHTGLHCSEVGACQSSKAQYRVYRHACTCQPGREGWGEGWGRGREQRRVSSECVESGRQDGCATLQMYTETPPHGCVHVNVNVCANDDVK